VELGCAAAKVIIAVANPNGHILTRLLVILQELIKKVGFTSQKPPSSLLKKGTGSERPVVFLGNYGPPRGACPLFQQAARGGLDDLERCRDVLVAAIAVWPLRECRVPARKGVYESAGTRFFAAQH
jgi:hypothetical protein